MNYRILVAVAALLLIIYVYLRGKENAKKLSALNYWYVALLFSFYPLIFSPIQGYYAMGIFKCRIWAIMTICLVLCDGFVLISKGKELALFKGFSFNAIDIAMLVFLLTQTISFCVAKDKKLALVGAEGWYTGLLFQYGIVLIYFSVSRFLRVDMRLVRVILVSAMIVFAIGILHRFLIDPIGIYGSLSENEYVRFLSTIGQATWYSAYLCVIFPLGLHIFLFGEKRVLAGAFLFLSAATLVTQNSDTAYGAFFVIMVVYLYKVITDRDLDMAIDFCEAEGADCGMLNWIKGRCAMTRYGQAVVIMSAAIMCIGALERAFAGHMPVLDDLSLKLAQGYIPVIGIIAGVILMLAGEVVRGGKKFVGDSKLFGRGGKQFYGGSKQFGRGDNQFDRGGKKFGVGLLIFVVIVIIVTLVGISFARNNAGELYFSWGRDWGNGRGLIWTRTMQMYADLPFINKIFGVGQGHFYEYISGYTELVLANAHNEWLTMLVESGIVGGVSYLTLFIATIIVLVRGDRPVNEFAIRHLKFAIAVTILAYIVHGMFNYQQCISTPMIFALIASS